jgi:uncharacterized protein YjbJ (UPF0337 family)/uncharacterized membrane protein
MAQRVTAIFHNREDAERAVDALVDLGAERSQISTLARGQDGMADETGWTGRHDAEGVVEPAREVGDSGAPLTTSDEPDAAQGAATGAAIGAVAGIAAGLAALMVPGFGLVLTAGPLSWALGGAIGTAAAGAVAGGVYGSLRDIGIEEHHARGYEERIRGGHVLLTALVPNFDQGRAREILSRYGGDDISFTDDMSTLERQFPAGESALAQPGYSPTSAAGPTVAAPLAGSMGDTTSAPSSASASMAGSSATGDYNSHIARGEAKQAEGEWRDRAADRTVNPLDDLAAKGEKAAGKVEEEYGEEEEAVRDRT